MAPAQPASPPALASTTTCWARWRTTALFDLEIRATGTWRSTSTTRSRTWRSCWAPPSPRRSATGPASGASAPLRCPWTSPSRPPSSTSAVAPTRSSTCPSAPSVPARSPQLVDHALASFAQAAGRHAAPRAVGRNDHHLAEAAFKALARALRMAFAPDPRRAGVASTKGSRSGDDRLGRPRVVVVDYGAGNLVSIEQALSAAGARSAARRPATTSTTPDRLLVPGVGAQPRPWIAFARAASSADPRLDRRRSPVPRHLPRPAAALRAQRRGRRAHAGSCPPHGPPRGRPQPARTSAGTGSSAAGAPGPRRTRGRHGPLLRALLRARARRPDRRGVLPTPSTGGRFAPPSPATGCWASSSTPSAPGTTACG